MRILIGISLTAGCWLFSSSLSSAQAGNSEERVSDVASAETLIRAARERFNQAIERQDIETIKTFFLPEYHIVTGRSAQSHGRENEARQLQQLFAGDPTFVCRRTTRETRVNVEWGLAEELGDWRCDYTVDTEKIHSTGVYAAKWQRSQRGQWLLQSEVFTTLHCAGSETGCRPPDPIE